ncbi:hypothetical protein H9P43_009019 [Blastocladiella emersonii ATCC 22665]|nr:hypothetical protein H9P43_009019 [Blastocladiella emersonii ATCC 22665]
MRRVRGLQARLRQRPDPHDVLGTTKEAYVAAAAVHPRSDSTGLFDKGLAKRVHGRVRQATTFLAVVIKAAKLLRNAAEIGSTTDCIAMVTKDASATSTTAPTMTIDSDVLFLGLAKAIKVKYRVIEGNFGHDQAVGRWRQDRQVPRLAVVRGQVGLSDHDLAGDGSVASVKLEIKSLNIKEW